MPSRENILGNIRKSLEKSGLPSLSLSEIEARLDAHTKNTVPARSDGDSEQQTTLFITEAEKVNATTERIDELDDVGKAVMDYLARYNLPGSVKIAPHALLKNVNWSKYPTLAVAEGPAEDADQAGLSVAVTGVAETGTLVLYSGPQSPTTLNFLPDNHIVLLPQSQITAHRSLNSATRILGNYQPS